MFVCVWRWIFCPKRLEFGFLEWGLPRRTAAIFVLDGPSGFAHREEELSKVGVKGVFHCAENRDSKLIFISRGHVLRDWQWCKRSTVLPSRRNEWTYMTMTNIWMQLLHMLRLLWPSQQRAASMYWLLRHAQHARDINIHKLHTLPEKKIGLGRSADFLHSGTPLLDL